MKQILMALAAGSLTILFGCAHGHSRGTVVFKDSEKEGHVCIGHDEVKPGDVVKVYKNVCDPSFNTESERGFRKIATCQKQLVGEGKITEFSNEHFATIEALGPLNLEQGYIVEKAIE